MKFAKLPYKTKRTIIDGVSWEYIVAGKGSRTLLILPGGGQNAQSNWRLIKEFESDYKVIAITIYECNSINELVGAINKILEKERAKKLVVYGLSIGSLMAQSYVKRNKGKVSKLIISHGCAPQSKTYKRKVIVPLVLAKYILPFAPNFVLRYLSKFAGRVQGQSKKRKIIIEDKISRINKAVNEDFKARHWNKRLIKTWIDLHVDFFKNEDLDEKTFLDWKGKILILRTNNDPLMQDEGWFKKIYPDAKVHTFRETGHLTYYLQFENMVKVLQDFLW